MRAPLTGCLQRQSKVVRGNPLFVRHFVTAAKSCQATSPDLSMSECPNRFRVVMTACLS